MVPTIQLLSTWFPLYSSCLHGSHYTASVYMVHGSYYTAPVYMVPTIQLRSIWFPLYSSCLHGSWFLLYSSCLHGSWFLLYSSCLHGSHYTAPVYMVSNIQLVSTRFSLANFSLFDFCIIAAPVYTISVLCNSCQRDFLRCHSWITRTWSPLYSFRLHSFQFASPVYLALWGFPSTRFPLSNFLLCDVYFAVPVYMVSFNSSCPLCFYFTDPIYVHKFPTPVFTDSACDSCLHDFHLAAPFYIFPVFTSLYVVSTFQLLSILLLHCMLLSTEFYVGATVSTVTSTQRLSESQSICSCCQNCCQPAAAVWIAVNLQLRCELLSTCSNGLPGFRLQLTVCCFCSQHAAVLCIIVTMQLMPKFDSFLKLLPLWFPLCSWSLHNCHQDFMSTNMYVSMQLLPSTYILNQHYSAVFPLPTPCIVCAVQLLSTWSPKICRFMVAKYSTAMYAQATSKTVKP